MKPNRDNRFERLESNGSSTERTSSLSTSTSSLSDDSVMNDSTIFTDDHDQNHGQTFIPNTNISQLSDEHTSPTTVIHSQISTVPSGDRFNRPPDITVTVDPMPNGSDNQLSDLPTPSRFKVQNIDLLEFPPVPAVTKEARHSFGYHLTTSNSHTFTPSLLPHCYKNIRHHSIANTRQLSPDFFLPPKFIDDQRRRAKSHTLSEYERRHLAKFAANYPQLKDSFILKSGSILTCPDGNNNAALQLITTTTTGDGKLTFQLILSAIVCFFTNSLPSGFNMGVVNTPGATFKQFFNLTLSSGYYYSSSSSSSSGYSFDSMNGSAFNKLNISTSDYKPVDNQQIELYWSIAVSLLLIGAFVGCIFTGSMANTFGRRKSLFLNGVFGLMGVSLCWASNYYPSVVIFMIGRFISGLHTGVASSLVPMYLMEIAPKNLQTPLGIVHVTGMNGGQMVAQILGLETVFGTLSHWPLLFFVNACFIIIGLLGLFCIEESPVYLFVMKGHEKEAIGAMEKIRGQNLIDLSEDILEMRQAQKDKENTSVSLLQSLKSSPDFMKCLLIVCILHAGQQLIGINAIFFYSTRVFRSVGLDGVTSQYSSIGCTALNTITASVIAIPLIHRFCCRTLLLASSSGTLIVLIALPISMVYKDSFEGASFITIGLILTFVFIFALGLGPIPYMIGGELFDRSTMAVGMSVGCFINWLCNFGIAITFPLIIMFINEYVFIIFAIFNAILLIFIYFCVPKN